jgi:hypothetical protein
VDHPWVIVFDPMTGTVKEEVLLLRQSSLPGADTPSGCGCCSPSRFGPVRLSRSSMPFLDNVEERTQSRFKASMGGV